MVDIELVALFEVAVVGVVGFVVEVGSKLDLAFGLEQMLGTLLVSDIVGGIVVGIWCEGEFGFE